MRTKIEILVLLFCLMVITFPVSAQQHSNAGRSLTRLSDGRTLITGGIDATSVATSIASIVSADGTTTVLNTRMSFARSGHSATVLPDSTVLIFGGIGSDGKVVPQAERFDPATQSFAVIPDLLAVPRAFHTATLLTDGTVLLAGGVLAGGQFPDDIQLLDCRTNIALSQHAALSFPREGHSAELLSDGTIRLSGGTDHFGNPVTVGEIYDPVSKRFRFANNNDASPDADFPSPVGIAQSIPEDGAEDISIQASVAIRFTQLLAYGSVIDKDFVLAGPNDTRVDVTVTAAENGRLVFVLPRTPLQPGSSYTLRIQNVFDSAGQQLADTSISFQTQGEPPEVAGPDWVPGPNWTTGTGGSKWQELPALQAMPGVTALAGQVLKLSGWPLEHVTLEMDGQKTRTDGTGRFLLKGLTPGHHVLWIDASTANQSSATYGVYEVGVTVLPKKTNVLNYTIWMTQLDMAHAVNVPSPTPKEMVLTNSALPGLALHLPAGTTITDRHGKVVRQVSITPIPLDKTPFPLPAGVKVPIYFTVQPGGAYLSVAPNTNGFKGARLIYPNSAQAKPGTTFDFWNYDADARGWYVYGSGKVSADATSIIPNPGVEIYEFTGAMVASDGAGVGCMAGSCPTTGDPVSLQTGQFIYTKTDMALADVVPLEFSRTYVTNDSLSRSFGIGATNSYDIFMIGNRFPYTFQELILPNGARVRFDRVSANPGNTDAVYVAASAPGPYYGSVLSWSSDPAFPGVWKLMLKNGTILSFPESPDCTPSPFCQAVLQIEDRYGNVTKIDRVGGLLSKITTPNGRYITVTNDSSNRITRITDNSSRNVYYSYDTAGRLASVTNTNGGITSYSYDDQNRMLTITDPRNIPYLTNEYDAAGRVLRQTEADRGTYLFNWTPGQADQTHFLLSVGPTDGNGGSFVVRDSCWGNSGYKRYDPSCTEGYMPLVAQVDITDPRGYVRRVVFGQTGYITSDTHALGQPEQQTVAYSYYADNLLQSVTDSLGRITSFDYDSLGNTVRATRLDGTPNAVTSTFSYGGPFGQISSVTDPLNHTSTFSYDGQGNLTAAADPLNPPTTFAYNTNGQLASVTDALGNAVQFGYYGGDLSTIIDPLGNISSQFTDAVGRVVSSTDAQGHISQFQYNPLNLVTQVTDPKGNNTTFSYDPNGNLLSLTDALHIMTSTIWTYDNMDRAQTRTDPLLRGESNAYDVNGNLVSATDRKGQVTSFTYDPLNRLTLVGYNTVVNGGVTSYESTTGYTYDAGNRITQAVDSAGGTITEAYDNLDRLTSETTCSTGAPACGLISYGYDLAGRRTSMTVAGQPQVTYSYDNANRLTQIAQGTSTVGFSFDNASRRSTLTLSNGVNMSYTYDNDSRVTGITYKFNATTLGNLSYSYDSLGQRTQVSGSFARTGLPSAITSATYDAANELTNWNGTLISYDLNGNMLSDGTNSFSWNARNQVAALNSVSLQYDGYGRRNKNVAGKSFLFDGANAVQELSVSTVTANLLNGGIDEIFTRADLTGSFTPLKDALGSTVALVDSSGNVVTSYSYDPFGNTVVSGATNTNAFQYTGRENEGNGLYFYRARYYSSVLGRFINEDSARAGFNFYAYAEDDPIDRIDPFGLDWLNNTSDFIAGAGDSLTFGGTALIRRLLNDGCDTANTSSGWYTAGEYTETGAEIMLTLGSASLKKLAANASREVVYKEARQMTSSIVREAGEQAHHVNPLFGHPGGSAALFPTGGLPAWIHSSPWNILVLPAAEHTVEHLGIRVGESLVGNTLINPTLTAARAIRNSLAGRGCGCN